MPYPLGTNNPNQFAEFDAWMAQLVRRGKHSQQKYTQVYNTHGRQNSCNKDIEHSLFIDSIVELINFVKKKVIPTDKPKPQKMKVKLLVDDLNSDSEAKISAAVKTLQTNGDTTILEPMLRLLLRDVSNKVKADAIEFLSSLKDTRSVDEIMRLLQEEEFLPIRAQLLSTIWNSPLNYSYFLAEFVEIAVEGDFLEALECLTILENLEGPFEERHVLEAQLHLQDYLKDTSEKEPKKAQIMSEIAMLIKEFGNHEDDDISDFLTED